MGNRFKKPKVTTIHEQYVQEKSMISERKALKKKYLVRRLTVFFIFAILVSGYIISSIFSQASAIDEKKNELAKLEKTLEDLKENETVLVEQIQKLHNDEYLGQLARKYYYLSDDEEIIFALPEEEEENPSN